MRTVMSAARHVSGNFIEIDVPVLHPDQDLRLDLSHFRSAMKP